MEGVELIASIDDFRIDQAAWWLSLLIGLALSVVSYLLAPKPKKQKPPAAVRGSDGRSRPADPCRVRHHHHQGSEHPVVRADIEPQLRDKA